jgi:hypothetical protein
MPEGVETSLLLRCSNDFARSAAERLVQGGDPLR